MMKKYGLLLLLFASLGPDPSGFAFSPNLRGPSSPPMGFKDTGLVTRCVQMAAGLEQAHPDSAVSLYTQALHQADLTRDTGALQDVYRRLFMLFFKETRYQEAFDLAEREVAVGKSWKSEALQMKGYNNLAIGYQFLNDYQAAAAAYLKAATLAGRLGDRENEARILDNMSSLLLKLKDYQSAYVYGLRSATLSRAKNDSLHLISGLVSMGNAMEGLEKHDSALLYFNEAEALATRVHNPLKIAVAKANKGVTYLKQGQPETAIGEFSEVKALGETYHYPYLIAASLKGLAECEVARGNYRKAEAYTTGAITMARSQHLGTELAEMYDNMAMIKQHLGKPSEAYAYKDLYNQVNDSIMNLQIQTSISRMNIQYKAAKKDQQIQAQRFQLTRTRAAVQNRNTWLLLFLVVVVALILILVISWRNHQHKRKLHAQRVVSLQKEQEVIRLKALMDGKDEERQRISAEMHDDMGAGLTSILFLSNSLAHTANVRQAEICERIRLNASSLIGKMNEIIWSMNPAYDTLEDLVAYLRHQAGEMLEAGERHYRFDIPREIPRMNLSAEQRRNIYLSVKEALHNVLKHAGATEVDIIFRFEQGISILIRDNGGGLKAHCGRRFGNGLASMNHRMEAIGGKFEIISEGGVTVALSLPLAG